MEKYVTVLGEAVAEYTEKRSKFIATVRHCETEEEALEFLDEMRTRYWDARHNVFAYSIKGQGRFSDDGEPHGTAGKPVFDVINGEGVTDLAVVVTRYFGGVLLGTGGLVRAYSKSAKDALENAKKAEMIPCMVFETVCEYTDHGKLLNLIEAQGGIIEQSNFTDKVVLRYSLRDGDTDPYMKKLSETFSARLKAEEIGRKTVPFEKI
ncbi:MAG: YigZ family protein [Acutalibacteraceae bacterium]|nr:YigZ family protein [Acutalibacteraceae bacterium]